MALTGKLVTKTLLKSDADAFFELFRYKTNNISYMSPMNVKSVDLNDGEWGSVGSVITWNFIFNGKECVSKERIDAIDEEKKLMCFKVIDGVIMTLYKSFKFILEVDTKGEQNIVTWTLTYEKAHANIEDPHTLMELCLTLNKDIETNLNMQCN